ncbi:hypothetical protein [Rhizobium mulingense]|uniref:hypothetical protein n=1 Tax=Rhizobium mulingense TaxID=3031128 RepID=UPI002B48C620|nr:hypothetical protein [Rhizobium sp. MJ21]MEB3043557.1 hypothetical protein [Rhizobium sp. MJ21]
MNKSIHSRPSRLNMLGATFERAAPWILSGGVGTRLCLKLENREAMDANAAA